MGESMMRVKIGRLIEHGLQEQWFVRYKQKLAQSCNHDFYLMNKCKIGTRNETRGLSAELILC